MAQSLSHAQSLIYFWPFLLGQRVSAKGRNVKKLQKISSAWSENVVAKVRFPIIPVKEIMETVVPKQLLTHEDVGRLIYEAQTKEKTTEFLNEHRTNIVKVEYYCIK